MATIKGNHKQKQVVISPNCLLPSRRDTNGNSRFKHSVVTKQTNAKKTVKSTSKSSEEDKSFQLEDKENVFSIDFAADDDYLEFTNQDFFSGFDTKGALDVDWSSTEIFGDFDTDSPTQSTTSDGFEAFDCFRDGDPFSIQNAVWLQPPSDSGFSVQSAVQELSEEQMGNTLCPEALRALKGLLIGSDYFQTGQFNEAISAFQDTIDIFQKQQKNPTIKDNTALTFIARLASSCLLGVGDCLWRLNMLKDALSSYKQMLSVVGTCLGKSFVNRDVAHAHFQMALIHKSLDNPKQCLSCFQQALHAYRQCPSKGTDSIMGVLMHNLGNSYAQMGSHSQALEHYKEALNIWSVLSKAHMRVHSAPTLNQIGLVHYELGEFAKAANAHGKAMQILSHRVAAAQEKSAATAQESLTMDRIAMIRTLHWLGRTHVREGGASLEKALSAFRASSALIKLACGELHPWMAVTHEQMACVYEQQRKYAQSLEAYKDAWVLLHRHYENQSEPSLHRLLLCIVRVEEQELDQHF